MKNIFLIGDSIRQGYDLYVKESMVNLANVYYTAENNQNTPYILRNVHNWKSNLGIGECDVIHFNVGHWDTLRIYGDEPLTKPHVYADNIKRIAERLQFLFPSAALIFATSTPVIESGYIQEFECRYNHDVEEYNAIAVETLKPYNVTINDLYSLLDGKPELHSDQSHYYTADATALIGGKVIDVLCDVLQMDRSKLFVPDKEKFAITTLKNDNELYIKKGDYYEMIRGI